MSRPRLPKLPHDALAILGSGLRCGAGTALNLGTAQAPLYLIEASPQRILKRRNLLEKVGARAVELALDAAAEASAATMGADCGVALTVSKGLIEELEQARAIPDELWRYDAAAGARAVARTFELNGPVGAAVAACASGLASIKLGQEWLRDGRCAQVLAGAAESTRSLSVLRSFERLGVLSPDGVTRPFDVRRAGFVVGEGAAVVRLQLAARAGERSVLGYLRSLVLAADGFHLTRPDPSGAALAQAIETALKRAELEPAQIGFVQAHATGTVFNDAVEIRALRAVFGKSVPPVTASKCVTGHLLGASGAVALVLTLHALNAGVCPPISDLQTVDPEFEEIDFVRAKPRHIDADAALILNHGFGGHIAVGIAQGNNLK